MANDVSITNQEQANQISRKHRCWVLGDKDGACAVYIDTHFKDLVFWGACFKDAIFRGCVFHCVDFSNANLMHADFRDADLTTVDVTNALLVGAKYNSSTKFPLEEFENVPFDPVAHGMRLVE